MLRVSDKSKYFRAKKTAQLINSLNVLELESWFACSESTVSYGGKPKVFTNSQRIRLARKAKGVGRRTLFEILPVVTPDTLLKWYRKLVARKWTFKSERKRGRPRIDFEVEQLVLKMLQENPQWGSDRVVGALANLGIRLTDTTIDHIRKRNGLLPTPLREHQGN